MQCAQYRIIHLMQNLFKLFSPCNWEFYGNKYTHTHTHTHLNLCTSMIFNGRLRNDATKGFSFKAIEDKSRRCTNFSAASARECYAIWICCVSQKVAFPLMNRCFHTLNDTQSQSHICASDNSKLYRDMWLNAAPTTASIVCMQTNAVFFFLPHFERIIRWWMASFAFYLTLQLCIH